MILIPLLLKIAYVLLVESVCDWCSIECAAVSGVKYEPVDNIFIYIDNKYLNIVDIKGNM